jgi:hypothetical protein
MILHDPIRRVPSLALSISLVAAIACCATSATSAETPADRALAAFAAKNWPVAAAAYAELAVQNPGDALTHLRLGVARLYLGDGTAGLAEIEKAESIGLASPMLPFRKACAHAVLGDKEAAFADLDRAAAAGFANAQLLESEPLLASLRSDSRFVALRTQLDRQQFPCKYDPKFRQFDYWVGEWDVVPNGAAAGAPPAENIVTLEHGDCIVHEHWKGNSTGESFNLYDASRDAWFQTWVDSGGGMHEYKGGLDADGNMAFTAELAPTPGQPTDANGRVPTKLTFFKLGPDKVRQLSEQSSDGGKTWQINYDLIYTRRAPKGEAPTG